MNRKLVLTAVIVVIVLIASVFYLYSSKTNISDSGDLKGDFCGGIVGVECPVGYSCKMEGDYPDASGYCVFDPF